MGTDEHEEMRRRNGAVNGRDREYQAEFLALRERFCGEQGISQEVLAQKLAANEVQATEAWSKAYFSTMSVWCGDCRGWHRPTDEHPLCALCSSVHAPTPLDAYVDYRGWRWTAPFICMGCGIEVCIRQWAYSRSCGPCDVSHSRTRRLRGHQCFVGPHERLDTWSDEKHDIPEDHFIGASERDKYKLINLPVRPFPVTLPTSRRQRRVR